MKKEHGVNALLIAIGELAIKDYKYYIRRHNRLVKNKTMEDSKRKVFLYHNAIKMRSVEYFFVKDPYDIFRQGVGEKVIATLRADGKYIPCKMITDAEYTELLKSLEK